MGDSSRNQRDTVMEIIAAMRFAAALVNPAPDPRAKRIEQHKAERWNNRFENARVLLGIFEWRYVLLPIGVRDLANRYYVGDHAVQVKTRNLYIFGVRIARWSTGAKMFHLVPEPPPARLRLRPWRRKVGLR